MTCKPDRRWLAGLAAGCLAAAALVGPLSAAPADDAIAEALAALDRGDGVAAEVAGKRALEEGASRSQVAALIGAGEFLQGDLRDARQWLAGAGFDAATRKRGLHALARLELSEDNLPAAAEIFDRMIAMGEVDGEVWVDIGRMRYRAGQHRLALEAANEAVRIDPGEPRALEFYAQLTRDVQGLRAALSVFERALANAPEDGGLLAQYAATLGDAGEHARSLAAARELVELGGETPYAFYIQAILAARAGEDDLARRIWWRTDKTFDRTAAGLAVSGILEFRGGNYALAVAHFDALRRLQPFNESALLMLSRVLVANGEANVAASLLEPLVERSDASPYVLTLAARAHEQLGERGKAGVYLDRAAAPLPLAPSPHPAFLPRDDYGNLRDPSHPVMQLRILLADGERAAAERAVADFLERFPGSLDLQMLAGDVRALAGDEVAALERYRAAAELRSNWPVVQRMAAILIRQDRMAQARRMLAEHILQNPRDQEAIVMLARLHRAAGNPSRATLLLRQAAQFAGGERDPALLAELAEMELALGNQAEALVAASTAHDLSRSNRRVAQVLARAIELGGGKPASVQALSLKAQAR
ncbi:tetratricopeptide repeat protein [Alteraurantiacibacter aquimixticola]|nr:tetratricopeptide repeat protein [Alteraurantiacibacter aquimixticola]